MERIEITNANISLSHLVKQVSRDRVPVELVDGQVPLARLVPIDQTHSMAALDRALRDTAMLGDDVEAFSKDVRSIRESLGELDDPWES